MEGIEVNNLRFDMGPPNVDIPDGRPKAPERPGYWTTAAAKLAFASTQSDIRLPWAARDKLCPDLDKVYKDLAEDCDINFDESGVIDTVNCINAFANFYPCLNYLLRASKIASHGIDGLIEFSTVYHVMKEAPFDFFKSIAMEKPWDEEFDEALAMLGLGVQ